MDAEGSDGLLALQGSVYKCFTSNRVVIGYSIAILFGSQSGERLSV